MRRSLIIFTLMFLMLISACETGANNLGYAEGENLEITLNAVEIKRGDLFAEAPENHEFLVIEVDVKNNDTTSRNINASLMFELTGDHGGTYQYDAFDLSGSNLRNINGSLQASENRVGDLVFSVHTLDTNWDLMFTPGIFSGQTYTISFNRDDLE